VKELIVSPTADGPWTTPTDSTAVHLRTSWAADDVAVLAVAGEVDNSEAATVETTLQELLRAQRTKLVVLDLSAVTFFGSRGLEVVVAGARTARSRGVELRGVTGPDNRRVLRPLDITGVDQAIRWFPTAGAALDPDEPDPASGG
jgi:anti-sigma B factor antagonist